MDAAVEALLAAKVIAVVGLDNRTWRPAYRVASYLHKEGYKVVPVPFQEPADQVLGEKAYGSILAIPEQVDLVDVFVRSEDTDAVIDDAIAAGVGAIWLQEGITNDDGLARARAAGLVATQDRCTMVEHKRAQSEAESRRS